MPKRKSRWKVGNDALWLRNGRAAWRDTLVLTYRAAGFQGDD